MKALLAQWPAPDNIVAMTTLRHPGGSMSPFEGFNIARHVGDDLDSVEQHRQQLKDNCEGLQHIQWLDQVHSHQPITIDAPVLEEPTADASITDKYGLACAVMTADCLPVLICDQAGQQVAAAHAGWRGLAAGILENTVSQFNAASENILVWLGPAIGATHFEVGPEVRKAFLEGVCAEQRTVVSSAFRSSERSNHYYADLYQLARYRLMALGIKKIYGDNYCTYADKDNFFSYRRDGQTGRMASLIYKKKNDK